MSLIQRTGFYLLILLLFSCHHASRSGQQEDLKIFRFNQPEGLSSLDPAYAEHTQNLHVVRQLFNGLVTFDNNMKLTASLAEKWEISPDGKVYTFYLRPGVRFHDSEVFERGQGREVVADDFVYSFKRILSPESQSPGAWVFRDHVLKNAEGGISDTCFMAADKYIFKIYLQDAFMPFLQILTIPYTSVVPKEAVNFYKDQFKKHPVGTGPFRFKSWLEFNELVLVKNPGYFRKDSTGRSLPYLDEIRISFIPDEIEAFKKFEEGKLDFMYGLSDAYRELVFAKDGSVAEEYRDKFNVYRIQSPHTEFIGIQLDPKYYNDPKHPLLDVRVRRAMNYALDRQEMLEEMRHGLGKKGDAGIVPPLPVFGAGRITGYKHSEEKVMALLAEAGYPGGKGLPEMTLYAPVAGQYVTEYIEVAYRKYGIPVKMEINNFVQHQHLVDQGRAHMFRMGWLADYPDAENYLTLFYSKNFTPNGPNRCHYSNPEFDKLYEQVCRETNDQVRNQLYHRMDQLLMDDSPAIILYYEEGVQLVNKNVIGKPIDISDELQLETVDVQRVEGE